MIKYNLNTINDWNFGTSNVIKVYRNNAIVFYKVSGESPTPEYKVCFAVVDDISQYQETEFEDVFDKATEKWYKLNNLNQYEEYGVYVDSLSGSTRLPQGYTEVEYVTNNSNAYIDTGLQICSATSTTFKIESTLYSERVGSQQYQNIICCMSEAGSPYQGFTYRFEGSSLTPMSNPSQDTTFSTVNNGDGTSGVTITCNGITNGYTHSYPLVICCGLDYSRQPFRYTNTKIYSFKLTYNNTLTLDYVPCKRKLDGAYGLYDLVGGTFVASSNNNPFSGGNEISKEMTVYEGKLAIVDGYEYMWSGSSWVNLGEVSGGTAQLPDVPFTVNYNAKNYDSTTNTLAKTSGQLADVDAVITAGTPTVHDTYLTIATNTRAPISGYQTYFNRDASNPNLTIISKQRTDGNNCHLFANRGSSYNWMYRPANNKLSFHGSSQINGTEVTQQPVIESIRVDSNSLLTFNNYTDNTSSTYNNFNYGNTNSQGTALFAGYYSSGGEWFSGDFYWIYMSQSTLTDEQVQQVIDYNEGNSTTEYPKYYDDKSAPLDDLTFNTMAEAQTYAYNNCVYNGMKAIINGDRYYFDSTDENGWVKITEYYKVEDVTPNGASGWTITNSAAYNPDSSYYDDFDLVANSTSFSFKIAKVTIYGYDHFTYYLRSYHGYSSSYGYAVASNIDELSTDPTILFYTSYNAITHTYGFNKTAKSAVNLSNYRRVTYNNLDKTVEHTFYVAFYGRTYSIYKGNATILIPKDQNNENWEQVTFSASSNVASTQKNLYIDNNYSTSGGTQYFYYRWMVGLPSGSHSSYSNYSSYDYCPNVTSSTFTSVAGNSRQVNYSWDAATNKVLRFWLVDTSGNTLTPTDTVYYSSHKYNSCNASSYSNILFTTSNVNEYFKNGGRFTLSDSSDRHYIYGYTPPTLEAIYDVDDYENDFYIRYTKLDDEAVTITYTTYDPNDSETPTFDTEITYPYNGGTKVTTAATSYNVPYTYPYEVSQTSNKFSADSQSYTAGQTSRTISFTLYPDNREFATVADMEAYGYAWEGMNATVGDTKYQYKNGEWIEQSYTQYEYIQTRTGNYKYDFNTNFYPTTANTIELKFTLTGNSINWGSILCWSSCNGDSCDSTQFRFTTVTAAYAIIGRKGNASGTQYYSIGNGKTLTVTLPLSSSTYTYNTGSTNTTCSYNVGTFSLPSSTPMRIFNLGYASDNRYAANVKLYYVKVYDGNGNLVKHYVPSDSNGTPCLYEIVNGTYILDTWTGSYHGTLTLGPEV